MKTHIYFDDAMTGDCPDCLDKTRDNYPEWCDKHSMREGPSDAIYLDGTPETVTTEYGKVTFHGDTYINVKADALAQLWAGGVLVGTFVEAEANRVVFTYAENANRAAFRVATERVAVASSGEDTYLLLSLNHRQTDGCAVWWGPDRCGYTHDLDRAGRYSYEEATEVVDNNPASHRTCVAILESDVFRCLTVQPRTAVHDEVLELAR